MFSEEFINNANKFNFKVTLPALLIKDLMNTDFKAVFDVKYFIFCFVVTLISILVIWGFAKIVIKNKSITGEFVQTAYRSSAAVLGTAFAINIYGNTGMVPLMIIGSVPLYNVFAVIVLSLESKSKGKVKIKDAVINIIKNPILIGIVIGLVLSVAEIKFPTVVNTTLDNFAKMATPLALVCIGAAFEGRKAIKLVKPTLLVAMIKLVILPVVFVPVAVACGFTGAKLVAVIIMLGAPATPSCYIMARNMGYDGVLTSGAVVLTTVMSAFTITACLFVVRYLGLV